MSRPFSDDWQFKNGQKPRPSSEQTQTQNHQDTSPSQRPFSDSVKYASKEAEVIDNWFEDLDNYEKTLEQMSGMKLDENMKQELRAVNAWFLNQNECERTTIIYNLIRHCSQLQVRFFLMVLQQMANKDPIASLLSPRSSFQDKVKSNGEIYGGRLDEKELEASERLLRVLPPLRDNDTHQEAPDTSRLYNRHSPQHRKELEDKLHQSYTLSNKQQPVEPLKPHRPAPPIPYHLSHPKDSAHQSTKDLPSSPQNATHTDRSKTNSSHIVGNGSVFFIAKNESDHDSKTPPTPTTTTASPNSATNEIEQKPQLPPRTSTALPKESQKMDIPTWLKSLRLHKYTPIFENMTWDEMVMLNDDQLQNLGMAALGARRKILREFELLVADGYPPPLAT